jgi:hypothetical protein
MSTPELWLPVPGHDKYIVSELGRVARLLTPAANSKGYLKVSLYRGPGQPPAQPYVHQIVLLAFQGPPPPGHNVDHEDFKRANNARANLRYLPKHINDWRWKDYEANHLDPADLERWDREAAAALARGDADTWTAGEAAS